MKRILLILVAGLVVGVFFFGCSAKPTTPTKDSGKDSGKDSKVEALDSDNSSIFTMGSGTLPLTPAVNKPSNRSGCSCGANCTCVNGECGDPSCPSLRVAKRGGCRCGSNCTCVAGECGDPNCPSLANAKSSKVAAKPGCPCPCDCGCCETGVCKCCRLSYKAGLAKAKQDGKSLVLWVGVLCPQREKALADCVHAYADEIPEDFGKDASPPYVVVGKYENGDFVEWRGFRKVPSVEEVKGVQREVKQIAPASQPLLRPQVFLPPPMRPIFPMGGPMGGFGGFGGGMMMGGFGGGGRGGC